MKKTAIALTGVGIGAATMFVLDPSRGRGRRVRLRESVRRVSHSARAVADLTVRDVRHRASGVAARLTDPLFDEPPVPDRVLAQRVRARLGRLVSHPGAIDVATNGGRVTLSGPVFTAEVRQLLAGVRSVEGVTAVDDRLERHEDQAHISSLQGAGPRELPSLAERWLRWTPTARLIATLAGLTLVALSSPNRPVRGAATGIAGVELLERALLGSDGRS